MEEDALEVAGEQDDLLEGIEVNLYSRNKRLSRSLIDGGIVAIFSF